MSLRPLDGDTLRASISDAGARGVLWPSDDIIASAAPSTRPPRALQPLSGVYCGQDDQYRVELLIEVDLSIPRPRITADFYRLEETSEFHLGWCLVRSASCVMTVRQVVLKGVGRFNFAAAAPLLEVTIAHSPIAQPHAPAELRFLNTTLEPGAAYRCEFREPWPLPAGDNQHRNPATPTILTIGDAARTVRVPR